jgi:hypothetical protein
MKCLILKFMLVPGKSITYINCSDGARSAKSFKELKGFIKYKHHSKERFHTCVKKLCLY